MALSVELTLSDTRVGSRKIVLTDIQLMVPVSYLAYRGSSGECILRIHHRLLHLLRDCQKSPAEYNAYLLLAEGRYNHPSPCPENYGHSPQSAEELYGPERESIPMAHSLRDHLWDCAVLLVCALPALGYLDFLSQFVFGEPTGLIRGLLEGLFLFTLPLMPLYSILLETIPPVDQNLGTAGFFVFIYVFAVVLVWATRHSIRLVRDRPSKDNSRSDIDEA